MLTFILNETTINTPLPAGMLLLDFIRYHQHLMGTKIGCREGDCGACTILVGTGKHGHFRYSSATSCLMPLGNAAGKHIVTIEGINGKGLNAVQQAFADEGATQCGFCTPGFVMSLAGFCCQASTPSLPGAIAAMDGNICRCTGYKSIERVAKKISTLMAARGEDADATSFAVEQNIIPAYFTNIPERLMQIQATPVEPSRNDERKILGGGTDLYVQQPERMESSAIHFVQEDDELKGITVADNMCSFGGNTTATDIAQSAIFQKHFPRLQHYIKLVSSTPIRNMATIAGNFINASPIGDFTIFFLALRAEIIFIKQGVERRLPLQQLYKGYKDLDKNEGEMLTQINFELPTETSFFNFEKVCKRTYLDIASVNTAIHLVMENNVVQSAALAAGGVGPIPLYLEKSSTFLAGKEITAAVVRELLPIVQSEISPISDARGTAPYKRLLLQQLIKAHFLQFNPGLKLD